MATRVRVPVDVVPRQAGHFGAWRALTAVPAMVGSALLLIVLFGWLGEYEGAVLLGWIGSGAAVFSRTGERLAVRVGAGFRRPTKAQRALLAPAWSAALGRCGLSAGEVHLYVQRSRYPNAFAAGRRSVAVTTGVLTTFSAHRTGDGYLVAILTHELGHHATRATKFAFVTMWLALPWRFASRLVIGIGLATAGRRQPRRLLGLVALTGVAVAVVQAAQQRQWAVTVVLSSVTVCAVVCPLIDAAVSRRSEYAADRFAATCGEAAPLSTALTRMNIRQIRRFGWTERALSQHPSVSQRVEALDAAV